MNYTILIVDDEEIIRNSLSYILKTEGYEVIEAEDGEMALEIIEKESFDLIITDIKMPRMDGITLMEQVSRTHPETFFIIITAFGSLETAVNALRSGAYDYILKPLEFDDVETFKQGIVDAMKMEGADVPIETVIGSVRYSNLPSVYKKALSGLWRKEK